MMRLRLALTTYVLSGNGHSSVNHSSPEQFRTLHDEEGNARIVHTVIQFRQTEDSIGRPVSQIIEHVMGGHACSMERYFLGGQQGTSHCTKEFSVRLLPDFMETA
jgi:hypothetical protein